LVKLGLVGVFFRVLLKVGEENSIGEARHIKAL